MFALQIYFHNDTHPEGYLTRTGKEERPFVLSFGRYLYIKFETGQDVYDIPYVGFKAFYQFVTGKWGTVFVFFYLAASIGGLVDLLFLSFAVRAYPLRSSGCHTPQTWFLSSHTNFASLLVGKRVM